MSFEVSIRTKNKVRIRSELYTTIAIGGGLRHQEKAIAICRFSDILLRAPSEDGEGVIPTFWMVHSILDGTFQEKETHVISSFKSYW